MNNRVSTGISGLDDLLLGGFLPHRSYLLVGGAGTGKTILSLQWLISAQKCKEQCLYITIAEAKDDVEINIKSFGWSKEGVEILDLTSTDECSSNSIEEYHIFSPKEVEQPRMWETIYKAIEERSPQRVVIDSVSQLFYLSTDTYQFNKHILDFTKYLNRKKITSILLFEPLEMKNASSVALAVDGVIWLRYEMSPGYIIGLRSIQIEKMRGSDFLSGYHPFKITNTGIHIYAHIIERGGTIAPGKTMWTSGIKELDLMLGGGIESGTTTIVSGPTGAGKSTLCTQFLINEANKGIPGIIITLEESALSFLERCRSIGMPVDRLLEHHLIKIVEINAMETYPDELLVRMRHYISEGGYKLVVIDSLRGYTQAMEEYGTVIPHLHNLITYLNAQQVTTFLVNEIESITGSLRVTEHGLSHLADNIILLRYVEYDGALIKIIGCLKKRLGNFKSIFSQLIITNKGIKVKHRLKSLEGILTGVASSSIQKSVNHEHGS